MGYCLESSRPGRAGCESVGADPIGELPPAERTATAGGLSNPPVCPAIPPPSDGLFERVCAFGNVLEAARKALKGKTRTPAGMDLLYNLEGEVLRIADALREETWRPGPFRTFTVREPKERRISAAPLADRVVHHAACNVLGPLFEDWASPRSYACRPGRGSHAAARLARDLARRNRCFLKADVRKFFESVDHEVLKGMLAERLADRRLLALLFRIVDHPAPGCAPGKGLPIGNLTSQHFANLYLDPLDRALGAALCEGAYLRYMDDFLLFAGEKPPLHRARALAREVLAGLRLELKEPATFVAPVTEGVPFLGLRIFPGTVRLGHAARSRAIRGMRRLEREAAAGRIGPEAFLDSARSRVGHLLHADTYMLRKGLFHAVS